MASDTGNGMVSPFGDGQGGEVSETVSVPATPAQGVGPDSDINQESIPAGGRFPHPDRVSADFGEYGTGSIGNGHKPFRVSGA